MNLKFKLGGQMFNEQLYVTRLGKQKIILGFPWLHKRNPIIDWKKEEITWKPFQIDWRCLMENRKNRQTTGTGGISRILGHFPRRKGTLIF
jgi:hypothetical protein